MCYKTDKYFYIIYITLQVSSENLRLARVTKLPLELSNNSARVFNILVDILDASSLQVESSYAPTSLHYNWSLQMATW